jgi:carbonic anhydrase/acetyltransferase-like protein (isoleucine patch superfamily)
VPSIPYGERVPRIHATAWVAPGAYVVGDVTLGAEASIWFNAVARGDSDAVRVGPRTNVQDGAVLHTDAGFPCELGTDCTVGHLALVHGARIGDGCLVGMGAVVLSGADIGAESLIAAGGLVPEGRSYPPRSLLIGSPVRRLRELTDDDLEQLIRPSVRHYLDYARTHRAAEVSPNDEGSSWRT